MATAEILGLNPQNVVETFFILSHKFLVPQARWIR